MPVNAPHHDEPVTSFAQIAEAYGDAEGGRMRGIMRSAAITGLSMLWQRTGRINTAFRTNRVHILNLHHVFSNEEEAFRRLLRRLRPSHSFISYTEAVERIYSGDIQRPYITFTFDDGLKSCVRAARVMREFAATACFFVCPPIIGETDPEKIRKFCHEGMREPVHEFMNWNDLERLTDEGHEVGSHTMTHPNMATLSAARFAEELTGARNILIKQLGRADHFAWPFGRFAEFSAEAAKAVFDCGYQSCASGVRGCHHRAGAQSPRAVCVRREHIIAEWPLGHSLYFIARSASAPLKPGELWPADWREVIQGDV